MAVEISPSVVIEKYSPVDAQFCMLVAIWLCHGEIHVLYQVLVGSGRYCVYSTAMRMPRFFMVVHHVVSNGAWHRVPSNLGCFGVWTDETRAMHYKNLCAIDGRILLAGEHASDLPGWQEGAVLSSLDAITRLHQRVLAA